MQASRQPPSFPISSPLVAFFAAIAFSACGEPQGQGSATDSGSDEPASSLSESDSGTGSAETSGPTDSDTGSATNEPSTDSGTLSDSIVDTDTAAPPCVRFVAKGGDGGGESWAEALPSVQDGIDAAVAGLATGAERCEVWVGHGVYYIYKSSLEDTIELRSKVDVYGGFAGSETLRGERDVLANPTVLDGHESAANFNDRVYHVLRGADDAVLDGFVVTGGWAAVNYDPADHDNYGAGLLSEQASPTVRHTWFVENESMWDGAVALFGKSSPRFEDCVFSDNLTGGLFALNSSPVVERCVFAGNRVSGLVANGKLSRPVVKSSVFAGNRDFGVESWYEAKVTLEHATIAGNFASADSPDYGGGVYAVGGDIELKSSLVHGNLSAATKLEEGGIVTATYTAIVGVSGEGNLDVDPLLRGFPLVEGGTWDEVEYDAEHDLTRLRDTDGALSTEGSAGLFVVPNTDPTLPGGPVWVPVAASTASLLTVVGDVSWLAAAGDSFALYDLRLGEGSLAIGAADPAGASTLDVTGATRDAGPDMGAFERL